MMNKSNIFRLLTVVILSSLTTYFVYHAQIFSMSTSPITVSFTARGNVDSPFALYYAEEEMEHFSENKTVFSENNLKNEDTKFDILLPCDHVSRIRVDFFERPGVLFISNIHIKGDRDVLFTYDDVKITNDLSYERADDGIIINSDKIDPYIEICDLNLNRGVKLDWSVAIVWVLSFILYMCILKYMSRAFHSENVSFLLCFLLMLFIPRFFVSDETVSLIEKRTLAKKPELKNTGELKEYGNQYEGWFNDHIFQREKLQNIHDEILNVFNYKQGKLYNDAFVGEDQWMFLRKDSGFENYANVVTFTNEELKSISQYLQRIDSWCTQKGKKFYFVIPSDKDKVYGEYYNYVKKVNPDSLSRAQQLIKYLKNNTNLKCISLQDRMIKEKKNGLLYYKQDTHWCELGAYYGSDELLNFIDPDKTINRCSVVAMDSMLWKNGDMRGMCPGYKERDYNYYKIPVMNVEKSECLEEFTHYVCPSRQGTVTVFGDSFGFMFVKYLSYSFGDVKLISIGRRDDRYYDITKEDIDAIDSDYVVFEIIERFIPFLVNH